MNRQMPQDPKILKSHAFNVLDKANNQKTNRRIKVESQSGKVFRLNVEVLKAIPFITNDVSKIEELKFFPMTISQGAFANFTFKEDTIYSLEGLDPKIISDLKITDDILILDQATKAEYDATRLFKDDRFIDYVNFINPLTKMSYTVIIDTLHNDMFVISGLSLILSDDNNVSNDVIFNISGIKIGTDITQDFLSPSDLIGISKDKDFDFISINKDKTRLHTTNPNVTAFGISLTRNLPGYIKESTNFPVLYDIVPGLRGDIQVARQDTIPNMFICLGTIDDLTDVNLPAASKLGLVPNSVLYQKTSNWFSLKDNKKTYDMNTKFSFLLNVY